MGLGKSKAVSGQSIWLNQLLEDYEMVKSYVVTPERVTGRTLVTVFTECL